MVSVHYYIILDGSIREGFFVRLFWNFWLEIRKFGVSVSLLTGDRSYYIICK